MLNSRDITCIACLWLILAAAAPAQEGAAGEKKQLVYVLKGGSASDLAGALGQLFQGTADVQVHAEASSNCLLVSAPPAVLDEVIKILGQLDRPPQSVALEVLILDLPARRDEAAKLERVEPLLDPRVFNGPIEDVLAKVQDLQRKGWISGLKRVRLTALDNQQASVQVGETKPMVTGSTVSRGGLASNTVTFRDMGTLVNVVPKITPDGSVQLRLTVEESRPRSAENNLPLGSAERGGAPLSPPQLVTTSLRTTLTVPGGRAIVASGIATEGKAENGQTLVIVTARLIEVPGKASK